MNHFDSSQLIIAGDLNLPIGPLMSDNTNCNHIDNPEQKRCVRELETCGFKCKLLIIIILIT